MTEARDGGGADGLASSTPQSDGDVSVAVRDDDARHDVLQHEADDREQLTRRRLRPVLLTRVELAVVDPDQVLVQRQRHRDGHGDEPDDADEHEAGDDAHPTQERVNYDTVERVDYDAGTGEL